MIYRTRYQRNQTVSRLTQRAVDRWVLAAFFERFLSFECFPFRRRLSSRPPATNAHRWAAG